MIRSPENMLRRVDPRGAPPGLRARALAAARTARHHPRRSDIWNRIWTSRPLRLAWTASLAAVLIAHVSVSVSLRTDPHPRPTPNDGGAYLIVSTVSDDELRALVDLPNIVTDALPTPESPTLDPHG
jgi:hypothetical protein